MFSAICYVSYLTQYVVVKWCNRNPLADVIVMGSARVVLERPF